LDNTNGQTVIERIKEQYENIFMAERKVADFILENPEKAVDSNVSQLANLSGVSDATVVRLSKRLGYHGYYQMRICLSRDLGNAGIGKETSAKKNVIVNIFQKFAKDIAAIGEKIDQQKLQQCATWIKECNYVHLIAVGNTSPLVEYMGFRLGRLGIRCTYNNLPEYFINSINLAQKDDIVFAISQSGSSKQVIQALELAKKKGLKTIVISGVAYSPVSRFADCLLLSNCEEKMFDYYKNYSHLKEMAVVDAVLEYVMDEDKIRSTASSDLEFILSENKI
jgi:RpiR family carbohydrate utilization transcriptional regulator